MRENPSNEIKKGIADWEAEKPESVRIPTLPLYAFLLEQERTEVVEQIIETLRDIHEGAKVVTMEMTLPYEKEGVRDRATREILSRALTLIRCKDGSTFAAYDAIMGHGSWGGYLDENASFKTRTELIAQAPDDSGYLDDLLREGTYRYLADGSYVYGADIMKSARPDESEILEIEGMTYSGRTLKISNNTFTANLENRPSQTYAQEILAFIITNDYHTYAQVNKNNVRLPLSFKATLDWSDSGSK